MEFEKKNKGLMVHLQDKTVTIRGHQDDDVYTVFTESLETHPSLSESEMGEIKSEIKKRGDIVVN